jgi:ferredoxin
MTAHPVRVPPVDVELLVDEDDGIFWASPRAGWKWPTVCDCNGECGRCRVIVDQRAENLTPTTDPERNRLAEG